MTAITQAEVSAASGYPAAVGYDRNVQNTKTSKENHTEAAQKSKVTNGRTIGEPKLSEKAQKYYDQLRKKYGNMDFILVSSDMKQQAKANAGRFANPNRMVVLIDEEKIEKMAEDEDFRKQYEGIISSAAHKMPQIAKSLGANADSVKGYGMQVDKGGTATFFAVIDKSLAAQKDRIEKNAAKKAEAKKQDKKAAEKKRAEDKRTQKAEDQKKAEMKEDDNTIRVEASSIEELIRKINDTVFALRSDSVRTDEERKIGSKFDFSI